MDSDGPIITKSNPKWIVTEVVPQDNYVLLLTFITGEKKTYDCAPLLNTGVFKQLKDPDIFKLAHVDIDTVAWNNEVDIAPETLYDDGAPVE